MKHGKKYTEALKKYDSAKVYDMGKAAELVKELKYSNFDETVEIHVNVKLSKSQTVRDTVVLPNQFKAEKKVLVFCKEDRIKEALDAGAAYAGAADYIEKVKGGWLDFDIAVATPDMMKMPNPKTGTVTNDIAGAISELKKGRTEFRADKTGVIHLAIGKVSMDASKIAENAVAFLTELDRKKPQDAKQDFVKSVSMSSTMGPGVWVNYTTGE